MTDKNSIIDQILSETETETTTKELTVGKYHTDKKFLNFIQGLKGKIRIFHKTAFLDGKVVSGMLEDVKFKVTICDDGGLNIEEIGTSQTDESMIQRIADEISEKEVIGYMKKYVLRHIEFKDEDNRTLYMEVEETKPIEKLFNLFEDEEKVVSETALSIIDCLFDDEELTASDTIEEVKEKTETKQEEPVKITFAQQMIMDSFNEMNREKIQELEDRIEKKERELRNLESTFNSTQKSIETGKVDLRVLRTRLDDMNPPAQPNGVVFYVSPENKTGIELDENLKIVANKVSEALKLKKDVVLDMLTQGYYTIKICGKDNLNDTEYVNKDAYNELMKLNSFGNISLVSQGFVVLPANEFEFRGDLNWHQLVDKMIKWGFEQDPEWDKICNSPSYQSEFEKEDETDENILSEHKEEESEMKSVLYRTYNQPETLVVLDITTIEDAPRGVEITDDESCFSLYIGNKFIKDYGCLGFVNILTMKEYNEFVKQSGEIDCGLGLLEGFVIPNFTGNIEFVAKNSETGRFTDEFDFSDYIQHQLNNDDDYFDVGIKLPEGTIVFDLNEDLTLPVDHLRDQKIEDIIK
jgi:uncharacterized coiled-coil protein SlyX